MKAIVVEQYGGPEELKLREMPEWHPIAGQVLVEIKAASVNPKDAQYRNGLYPSLHMPPFTPGIDGAGIVLSVGKGVTNVSVGDRVFISSSISGTYAEKALCHAHHVHLLSDNVSFAEGAGVGVAYATAFRALYQRALAVPGETILIHGASGGVGLAALQLARNAGFFIIGTAGTPEGMQLVKNEGADIVVCHREPDYLKQMISLNHNNKIDVILEMQAQINLGNDLTLLAKNGRVVVIGSLGTIEIDSQYLKDSDGKILSVSMLLATKEEMALNYHALQRCLKRGLIKPIINEQIPLNEAAKAHQIIEQTGQKGKIILVP